MFLSGFFTLQGQLLGFLMGDDGRMYFNLALKAD